MRTISIGAKMHKTSHAIAAQCLCQTLRRPDFGILPSLELGDNDGDDEDDEDKHVDMCNEEDSDEVDKDRSSYKQGNINKVGYLKR